MRSVYGMYWIGSRFSPIFSAHRCRYPRCGSVSEITSPSVRSTRRSTPWVLGCCGPMLTSISSVRTSNSTTVGCWAVAVAMTSFCADLTAANAVVFQREFIILAQRVSDPILREQDAAQVRVAVEPDAGQVVHFALMPVGGPPERRDRRDLRQLARLVVLPAWQN